MTDIAWAYRRITLDDVPKMLDWYNDRALHETANPTPFHYLDLDLLIESWQEKLTRTDYVYFVIEVEGRLAGRAGLKRQEDGTVLYSIVIGDTSLHSRGLGTAVTKQMLGEAFSASDIQAVQLNVRQDNLRAIRCYEKCGFIRIDSFLENGVPMFLMQVERSQQTKDKTGAAAEK